ncbi:spore coat protein [Virgibacillus sp. MG-45]|uniref:spore coat protein n=1 Tax=Virgibacillus sp. MG-45 TaxID=3102791 RepID=UPI002EDB5052
MQRNQGRCSQDPATQNALQNLSTFQETEEFIHIIDSSGVRVHTTDTQVGVSLQAALQVAIAIVINITIADSNCAEQVTQELLQSARTRQVQEQTLVIQGSENVDVTTSDTDVAVSIQVLLQILVTLVAQLDIL